MSGKQATDLYERLQRSQAARTGLLSELSECELFVEGIGPDKISDITTNIIRRHLIAYTQEQCRLHNIPLDGQRPSGWLWDMQGHRWTEQFVPLPVINGKKILLVPKASARWSQSFSHHEYYNRFVLEFLQAEHLEQQTALVETLRNGRQRVTKKRLKEICPLAKDFLATFTEGHPAVLARYKTLLRIPQSISNEELEETFDEAVFAGVLAEHLGRIPHGLDGATEFHDFMKGALEFIFFPHLIYPIKELERNPIILKHIPSL